MAATGTTRTRDITYDLVSVLYHALHGAETYQVYVRDAEEAGDREVSTFLRGAQEQMVQLRAGEVAVRAPPRRRRRRQRRAPPRRAGASGAALRGGRLGEVSEAPGRPPDRPGAPLPRPRGDGPRGRRREPRARTVDLDDYLRSLEARGARIIGPERMDRPPGWRCEVVLGDGRRLSGTGRTEAEAIASVVLKAQELEETSSGA